MVVVVVVMLGVVGVAVVHNLFSFYKNMTASPPTAAHSYLYTQ